MIKEKILDLIAGSVETVTPSELEKRAMSLFSVKRKEVKDAVKSLISEGHLSYACTHGRTVIGTSFNRPVRVSEHIVLKPAGMPFTPEPGDAVVELVHGASFGTGEHPRKNAGYQNGNRDCVCLISEPVREFWQSPL